MKISISTANYYSNVDLKTINHNDLVKKIGSQLGEVGAVTDWSAKYSGVIVARVASCVDHPNADKLHICKIDDGGVVQNVDRDGNGYVQVVCGAPNVREGLVVAWIPPGVVVPVTYDTNEPFRLGKRELRGVLSNGMLASPAELGLNDDHDGILEIGVNEVGGELTLGSSLSNVYGLDDFIVDVENKMFTHRPDCFGVLGIAREIAGITGQSFKSPNWYLQQPIFEDCNRLSLNVDVQIKDLVPRFMAVALDGITIKPSPVWMQAALTRVGIRPINNVVDVTNFVMYVTGQPLHAYDYDKLASLSNNGAEIIVRYPEAGEKINLLNGKQIEPRSKAIMIATPKDLIGVGGVMGGADTEVDSSTTRIVLEVASFDMYSIRRTSMEHGLFTDAVTRFNKGQSSYQNDRVLSYAIQQLADYAGAVQASDVVDIKQELRQLTPVSITPEYANARLGIHLSASKIALLLQNVEFDVVSENDILYIKPPFWRTDIEIPEDIVEEVGRLYGFDNLPIQLPNRSTEPALKDPMLSLKTRIRHSLRNAGANEVLSYSFVHGDLLKKVGQDVRDAYCLSNALSPNLQYYRLSLMPSLLEKIHLNVKAGYDEFSLFELGKAHKISNGYDDGVPIELESAVFVFSSKSVKNHTGAAFYHAVRNLQYLGQSLGLQFTILPTDDSPTPFEPSRSGRISLGNGQVVGHIGEFSLPVLKKLKVPNYSAGFELDLNALLRADKSHSPYKPLSKYPSVAQDITLHVKDKNSYAEVRSALTDAVNQNTDKSVLVEISAKDIFQNPNGDIHITFHLEFSSYDKTLRTEDVNNIIDTIAIYIEHKINACRI